MSRVDNPRVAALDEDAPLPDQVDDLLEGHLVVLRSIHALLRVRRGVECGGGGVREGARGRST